VSEYNPDTFEEVRRFLRNAIAEREAMLVESADNNARRLLMSFRRDNDHEVARRALGKILLSLQADRELLEAVDRIEAEAISASTRARDAHAALIRSLRDDTCLDLAERVDGVLSALRIHNPIDGQPANDMQTLGSYLRDRSRSIDETDLEVLKAAAATKRAPAVRHSAQEFLREYLKPARAAQQARR
jgi:hypothetical protein